ncbi:hypothetical protein [Streptomyces sp. LS1784]|uniref:hypothetical protein n=1 Tax=Streptomyces sp. LS1784 TaxID=2851533 RepID=UPI001CCB50CD|nr:hypothetical protein [Streptomyces sp. LS1784]
MAITTTAKYPTSNGGTVYMRQDDRGNEGYTCTGCDTLMKMGSDADARAHAAACTGR